MEPLTTFSSTIAGFNNAVSIVRKIIELKTSKEVKEKTSELLKIILGLQCDLSSLHSSYIQAQEEIQNLKMEIADLQQRIMDIGAYKLFSPFPGTFVYQSVNPIGNVSEPVPWICPNCFDKHGKKSILQISNQWAHCSSCNSNFRLKDDLRHVTFGR